MTEETIYQHLLSSGITTPTDDILAWVTKEGQGWARLYKNRTFYYGKGYTLEEVEKSLMSNLK